MTDFFRALTDPDVDLIRNALMAGIIAGITFGVVGSYVVARRISYVAAAIAHSILAGIGAAIFLQSKYGWVWCTPMAGAIVAALISAIIIGVVNLRCQEREDTVIGAIWSAGMAIGLVFLHFTPPQASKNLESFLFGNILLTSQADLLNTAILGAVVIGISLLFYNKLLAICFDEEFSRLRGVNVTFYYLLLLCLVGLSVVLLVRLTGIILAIALVVLPAATASRFTRRLWKMMVAAVILSVLYSTGGLLISFPTSTPTGPVVVLLASVCYLAALLISSRKRSAPSSAPPAPGPPA